MVATQNGAGVYLQSDLIRCAIGFGYQIHCEVVE